MKISPLRLEQLFLGHIRMTPGTGPFKPGAEMRLDAVSKFDLQDADSGLWSVHLRTMFKAAKEAEPIAYEGEIETSGSFRVIDESLDKEAREKLLVVNSLSILYSSAREVIALLSSQGLNGKLLLPSISFADQKLQKPLPVAEQSTSSKKRAQAPV
jgi:preprotein translocase subunit SecB